jgi:hypothetical protein
MHFPHIQANETYFGSIIKGLGHKLSLLESDLISLNRVHDKPTSLGYLTTVDKFDYFCYSLIYGKKTFKINPIVINSTIIEEVIIDSHVDKHSDHISDELIIELVSELVHTEHVPEGIKENFQYFVSEISHDHKRIKWFGF